ncbi:MAG TPA: N-acetylmuramoyl-L-alanine amidase [Nannocystis sp.]
MQRTTYLSLSSGLLTALALLAPGCDAPDDTDLNVAAVEDDAVNENINGIVAQEDAEPLDPPTHDAGLALSGIDADFTDAAAEFDVPAQLLQAIGYTETQWQMVEGLSEFDGQEPAFGVMALRGERLALGAKLAGEDIEAVKTDRRANIRAGAALLSVDADELGFDRSNLAAWAPAVARFSGIPDSLPEIQANYVHNDVYAAMRDGATVKDFAGKPIARLEPTSGAVADFALAPNPTAAPGPDYSGSIWRPSPNYSSRPTGVKMVVIHSCEGAYSGCWGWLVNKASGVSAHYVVKEDGNEISQLVKEASKAWHVAATYSCSNNSSKECGLNGQSTNNFSVGIEHAGFAKTTQWSANLIDKSAKLVCDITKGHNIPRDKYHIVAHGQLQPYNRIDPGPNWPWATYLSKINTHCGAAPPPPPPPPPPAGSTIVIDSNNSNNIATQAKIAVSANWTSTAGTPGYYGSGYFFANTEAVSDGAEFSFYLPAAATKTVDAWWTAGTNRSTTAPFVAFNAAGTKLTTFTANQSINGGKWVQLGTANFSAGWNKIVLSRWTTAGKVVIADAVRVR